MARCSQHRPHPLPAVQPRPSCCCISREMQLHTMQRDPKRPRPLQHRSRMSYYSIPGWESDCAGAVAASQHSWQGTTGVPGVLRPPPAEPAHIHPENPHFSIYRSDTFCSILTHFRTSPGLRFTRRTSQTAGCRRVPKQSVP